MDALEFKFSPRILDPNTHTHQKMTQLACSIRKNWYTQ
jgi:hypothetical protein